MLKGKEVEAEKVGETRIIFERLSCEPVIIF
jgi:hypothetical protein